MKKGAMGDKEQAGHQGNERESPERSIGGISRKTFAKHKGFVTLTMNEFLVSHLLRVYHLFEGDILQALILGAIAHHNVSVLSRRQKFNVPRIKKAILTSREKTLLPSNAFSISQATGIPRETVRRKIAVLIRKGLVTRDEQGHLFLTNIPQEEFADFTYETADRFLYAARRILQECQKDESGV